MWEKAVDVGDEAHNTLSLFEAGEKGNGSFPQFLREKVKKVMFGVSFTLKTNEAVQ